MEDFSCKNLPEFDDHRCVLMMEDVRAGLTAFVAIHRGGLQWPAFGATRFWHYASNTEALRDALRLSKMMSYKSALAGLKYGGAKAVIIDHKKMNPQERQQLLMAYAERLNYLSGKFITGTDVGLQASDLLFMKEKTPFLVGFKVDPTTYTALGLSYGLEVCLEEVFGTNDITGRTFAIEGLGKIGRAFLNHVYAQAAKVYVADLKEENLVSAKKDFPHIQIVAPQDLAHQEVDVYVPCGTHGSLNSVTLRLLRCKIIIGGANNQLESREIGEKLHQSGIIYAPDYVVNAGGLMSVTHEYEDPDHDLQKLTDKVKRIKNTLKKIFEESKNLKRSPGAIADSMAEEIIAKNI